MSNPDQTFPRRQAFPRFALFVCLLLLATVSPLAAQFAGPALNRPAEANQVQTPTTDPALLAPGISAEFLNSGDVIVVHIFAVPEYAPPVRVDTSGDVQLPLIGLVHVGGLTIEQADNLIARKLSDAGMYIDPQVTISISEASARFVTVTGELHATVPVTGPRRLLEILGAAGSLPPTASHIVTILRPGVAKPIVVDLGTDPTRSEQANIAILPRDVILISRVGVVYIIGAFKQQGAIALQQNSPLTLLQVAALSGGAGFEGKYKDLRIIRTEGLERKLVKVDYKRILYGQDPDPVLKADDIVFLPPDAIKAAIKGGGVNTLTSIASLLIITLQALRVGG